MDKDKIFDLFSLGDTKETKKLKGKKTPKSQKEIEDGLSYISTFCKIIKNHKLFNQKLKGLLKNMDENRSPYEIESASSIGVFLRSYHHIEKIDIKNKFHIRAVLLYNKGVLESCLREALSHFESEEEYEKCTLLHRILKLKQNF